MNRDIKEFQKRFERWKAGENYWKDIRGIDLFDDGKDDTNDDNNTWTKQGYAYIGNNDNGEPMYLKDSGVITNIIEREHPDGNLTYHYRTDNGEVPLQKMGDGLFYYEKEDGSTDYFDVNRAKAYRQWQKEGGPAKDIDKVALGIMSLPLAGGLAAEAVAAAPALAPGSAFWTNPMTQGVFASELGGRAWDAANVALTGNTWAQNLSKDIHRYTGWNPQESWGGQFLTEASNPGYFTPYGMVERGVNAATNGARKALDIWNSPLTGRRTTIGNRQYRLSSSSLGANGVPIESRMAYPQITEANAASLTPEQWTAAQDAAIARGDMAEAQRLRDLHQSLTPTATSGKYYRGTKIKRNSYPDRHIDEEVGEMNGIYLTKKPKNAKTYGDVEEFYLRSNNPLETEGSWTGIIDDATRAEIENAGYDAVVNNRFDTGFLNKLLRNSRDETITFNGKNLKSADAVTFDDNGVRIPLGERDNFNINDIRYGLLPFLGVGTAYGLSNKDGKRIKSRKYKNK